MDPSTENNREIDKLIKRVELWRNMKKAISKKKLIFE